MHFKMSTNWDTADNGPGRYVCKYSGTIWEFGTCGVREYKIGRFNLTVVDVEGAVNDEVTVFDVFDTYFETFEYYSALYRFFGGVTNFKRQVSKLSNWNRNLMILDLLTIHPKYRGRGLGAVALTEIVRQFRSMVGIVALEPCPMQFDPCYLEGSRPADYQGLHLERFEVTQKQAVAKLKKYYGHLGFVALGGTEFMVRDSLDPLPTCEILQEEWGNRTPNALAPAR